MCLLLHFFMYEALLKYIILIIIYAFKPFV